MVLTNAATMLAAMLSRVDALQAAARRYCSERAELWLGPFFSRGGSLAQRSTWARWDEELETYRARLRALDAIGGALPASTPAESASLEEARELLLLTAASAVDELLQTSDHSRFERRVIHEEERLFADYLRGLSDAELTRVEHPPFRRHLSERESARLWAELKARWGVEQGRVWFPHDRSENDEPPFDTHVFDADPFLESNSTISCGGCLLRSESRACGNCAGWAVTPATNSSLRPGRSPFRPT
jgi:hypothetical protein